MARSLRDEKMEVLCLKYEIATFKRAAAARGMTLSAWVRDTCRMQLIRDRAIAVKGTQVETVDDVGSLPMPTRCNLWLLAPQNKVCNGKVTAQDGFFKCATCGVSYGPVP